METGDIIYFLIAIVVFIGSLFEKNAKKRRRTTPPSPPPDVFKKMEHQKSPSVPGVKQVAYRARTQTYSKLDIPSSSLDSIFTREGDSDIPDELYTINELEAIDAVPKTTRHPLLETLKNGNLQQEMQKAIIYSEILHRKY